MPFQPIIIDRTSFEAHLAEVERQISHAPNGLFGPQSMIWKVGRESACFLGAGCALLLQVAHPWISQAIEDFSLVKGDPLGRFYRTFRVVFAMVYGTLDQALAQSRALYEIHDKIRGKLPEQCGPFPKEGAYMANEAHAALWVHATIWHTALVSYELILPPLTQSEKDRYYDETKRFAALMGIPEDLIPETWSDFEAYVYRQMYSDVLTVSDAGRNISRYFFHRKGGLIGRLLPRWYRAITAQLLCERLCAGFGLDYGASEEVRASKAIARIRKMYSSLPASLRYIGPYQEAIRRTVDGRIRPNLWIKALNLIYLGQTRLTP